MERQPNSFQPNPELSLDVLGLDPAVEQDRWIIDGAHGDPYLAWLLLCKEDFMGSTEELTPRKQKQRERTLSSLQEEIMRREVQLGIRQISE
jgi:hypothetical protein